MVQKRRAIFLSIVLSLGCCFQQMSGARGPMASAADSISAVTPEMADSLRQQALVDSLMSKDLGEVTVEADRQYTSPTSTVYIPTAKEKMAAQDAAGLLSLMAIPQIAVDPVSGSVTDNFGAPISVYINYMPATPDDRKGMLMANVRRVEVLDYPVDPRFRGEKHVINFIVQEYEYGGYTKLFVGENILNGYNGGANLTSKFTYKKWTYDLFASAAYVSNHHNGNDQTERFLLTDSEGEKKEIYRRQTVDNSTLRQGQYPFAFRASYNSGNIQIQNTVGFSHISTYKEDFSGQLILSDATGSRQGDYSRTGDAASNNVNYNGTFYFGFPRGYALNITPSFNYSRTSYTSDYRTGPGEQIIQSSTEDAYNYAFEAIGSKRFNQQHTLMLGVTGNGSINRVNSVYSSGNFNDRYNDAAFSGTARYNFTSPKIAAGLFFSYFWLHSSINGYDINSGSPLFAIFGQWSPSKKQSLGIQVQYATELPRSSMKLPDIVRRNEYLFQTGNPYLSNVRHISGNISYNWMPNNIFRATFYGSWFSKFKQATTICLPYGDGEGIIRTYANSGDYRSATIGANLNLRLFKGALSLSARPSVTFYKSTGYNNLTYNPFFLAASASYFVRQFFFSASYFGENKEYSQMSGQKTRVHDQFSLSAGWSNGHWNLRVNALNIFQTGNFHKSVATYNSPIYSNETTFLSASSHPHLWVTAIYTISYGKKIRQANEIGEQKGASSAIMK